MIKKYKYNKSVKSPLTPAKMCKIGTDYFQMEIPFSPLVNVVHSNESTLFKLPQDILFKIYIYIYIFKNIINKFDQ